MHTRSARLVALLALAVVLACACEEQKPDRLALDPAGPFRFEKKGATDKTQVAAFRGARPFTEKVPVVWKSSDPTVFTVDDNGTMTATGSGNATLTAEGFGLSTTAQVQASIVGSLEVKDDVPKPLKLNKKGHQLTVVVKDDKGTPIDKPLVRYRATDYCVEVSDDGFLTPLTEGDCDVIVAVADKSARVKLEVRER